MDDDGRVLVSQDVHGQTEVDLWILRFAGAPLRNPQSLAMAPRVEFVRWHRKEVFRKPARVAQRSVRQRYPCVRLDRAVRKASPSAQFGRPGPIAQLVELRTFNPSVPGSSPGWPTGSRPETRCADPSARSAGYHA